MVDQEPLRLLVADDHEMVLDIFAMYLSRSAGMEVTTARSLDEAMAMIQSAGPYDVVALDMGMPGMNGLAGLRQAVQHNGGKPVAIITGNPVARMVDEILAAGAAGILVKSMSARSLANAIRFMHSGERYLPLELVRAASLTTASGGAGPLTDKEMAVVAGLVAGRQNKEIAMQLDLAEPTVKMHVTAICRKLGARNRTQAVVIARDMGLV